MFDRYLTDTMYLDDIADALESYSYSAELVAIGCSDEEYQALIDAMIPTPEQTQALIDLLSSCCDSIPLPIYIADG